MVRLSAVSTIIFLKADLVYTFGQNSNTLYTGTSNFASKAQDNKTFGTHNFLGDHEVLKSQLNMAWNNNNEESSTSISSASEFIPETSFGSDVVPDGQKPVNEYLDLIRSPMFGWAGQKTGTTGLVIRLIAVYLVSFAVVCWPIAGATFTQDGYTLQKVAAANLGDIMLILVVLVRLYSGWGYVGSRLTNDIIEYEETGWYDGDFERKSEKEKKRDLFLYRNDVKPVEDRIKLVSSVVSVAFLLSCVGFKTTMDAKPLFNQYDPALLEILNSDDKAADVVQRQSDGRPTYCNSRYYRAVANGGQGCD